MPLFAARIGAAFLILISVSALEAAKKKKEPKEITQTLDVLPEPPAAVKAETARLQFFVSPLGAKGLLSQQVRDAIRALWRQPQIGQIVKLRAFAAGTGDVRRVQAIVAEMFSEKKLPLPAVTTIQVGALPLEGAQVLVEAVAVAKKPVNPHGLALISGQAAMEKIGADQSALPVAGLAAKSIDSLKKVLGGIPATPAGVMRVSCFTSSLDDHAEVRRLVTAEFPQAATAIVQAQRAPGEGIVECEAVARLDSPPSQNVQLVNPPGVAASANYSQAALVNAPRVVLTGAQLAFRARDADIRLAFERLRASLEQSGAKIDGTVMSSIYPLSQTIANRVRAIRFEYYSKDRPPASAMLPFEGLPSLDASFAIDVVAVPAQ